MQCRSEQTAAPAISLFGAYVSVAGTGFSIHPMHRLCLLSWLLLFAGGCTDPASDLGSDLLQGSQEPRVVPLAPELFATEPFHDITGATPRALAGTVDDPLMGTVSAIGHIDFDVGFDGTAPDVEGAALRLRRTYIYGDTVSMLSLAVHDILESWTATGSKADTALALGQEITTFEFLSNDTVVTVPMPEAWVDAYKDTLRHDNADSLFHGLAFVPLSGQAVVGFIETRTYLKLYTPSDTVDFKFQQSLTTTMRPESPMPPENRMLMQDAAGPTVRMAFDLDAFASQPINGAVVVVHVDTLALQEVPADFVRPTIRQLQLVAVKDEDQPAILVGSATVSEGIFAFSGSDVSSYFHRVLFGLEEYTYMELRAPVLDNSLNAMVLHDTSSTDFAPHLRLIFGS